MAWWPGHGSPMLHAARHQISRVIRSNSSPALMIDVTPSADSGKGRFASDNIIGPRCLRALQELGIARIYRSRQRGGQVIEFALLAEHGEDGSDLVGWKRKFRAREHSRIFFEHLFREAGMDQVLMDRQEDKRFISPGREPGEREGRKPAHWCR